MKKIRRRMCERYYDSLFYAIFHYKECHKNKMICKKYPWLMPRQDGTNKKLKGYHYQWTELDCMPDGWRKAFGEMMMEDILEACKKDNINPNDVRIFECKEKYGALRMYLNVYEENIQRVLDGYEQVSQNICIKCGKVDVPQTNFGWIMPECRFCYIKYFGNAKQYDDYYEKISFSDCIIPNYYTVHTSAGTKNIDLTWITKRLRSQTHGEN